MDKKSNVLDVNHALRDVGEALDKTASQLDLERHESALLKLQTIASARVEEIGRWKWSGHLKQNGSVPWTTECKNSNPQNLVWELPKVRASGGLSTEFNFLTAFLGLHCVNLL